MPKIMQRVPKLQLQTDNSSETEATFINAGVSSRSWYNTEKKMRKKEKTLRKTKRTHKKSQIRKCMDKRLPKKAPPKIIDIPKEASSALRRRSQIPIRLFVCPSASSTRLTTNNEVDSKSPNSPLVQIKQSSVICDQRAINNLQLQRTGVLAFRRKKSVSQMDFNYVRRMNGPINVLTKQSGANDGNNMLVKKYIEPSEMMLVNKQSTYVEKMYNSDNYYYAMHEADTRLAGMRVFTSIMLNAWRKRREEVKRLLEEANELKRMSVKTKNQLHVFNTLFRVEQKRNDELNCQLKRSLEDINLTKNSCEGLTTSLISLKADKALLEQQLQIKKQEFDGLNSLLAQAKADLFKAMSFQLELQGSLSNEQRKIQTLENQKNELINEICELNVEYSQKEENLLTIIESQESELESLRKCLNDSEAKINIFRDSKELVLHNHVVMEETLKKEISTLQNEIEGLQRRLNRTFAQKLKSHLGKSMIYQQVVFQMLHCALYCLLPATPPPKMHPISFNFSLTKALNIVKR